jgi:hypothetical protein
MKHMQHTSEIHGRHTSCIFHALHVFHLELEVAHGRHTDGLQLWRSAMRGVRRGRECIARGVTGGTWRHMAHGARHR